MLFSDVNHSRSRRRFTLSLQPCKPWHRVMDSLGLQSPLTKANPQPPSCRGLAARVILCPSALLNAGAWCLPFHPDVFLPTRSDLNEKELIFVWFVFVWGFAFSISPQLLHFGGQSFPTFVWRAEEQEQSGETPYCPLALGVRVVGGV